MVKKLATSKNKTSDIASLDLVPKDLNDKTSRMTLNIAFRPKPIRTGVILKKEYFVGSTAARVIFEATGGKITDYSRGPSFEVDYETEKRSQQSALKASPKFKVENAVSVELGEVSLNKDEDLTYKAKYSGSERLLADVKVGNTIEWQLAVPQGQVMRDYLFGNLELFVESVREKDIQGEAVLHSSDISFFDHQSRLISGARTALAMLYALFQIGIKIEGDEKVSFWEE